MALWESFDIPLIDETRLDSIRISDMTSIIVKGIDEKCRPFLAMRVLYDGNQRIGFIIQKYAHRNDEWEYGVLEHLDCYKMTLAQNNFMNANSYRTERLV